MRMQTLGIILTVMAMVGGATAVLTLGNVSPKMLVGATVCALIGWALIMLDPIYKRVS